MGAVESVSPGDPGEVARDFILEVLEAMGLEECEVAAEEQEEDGTWHLSITGEGSGALIGKQADALNALQYITTLVTLRRAAAHVRIVLDADNYRARREEALTKQAMDLAAQAVEAGQEAELEPLSAYERRIIHNALADHPEVTTYSEGEEPRRRVIIAPKPQGKQ
jgi:spoIIIJ-associated protein